MEIGNIKIEFLGHSGFLISPRTSGKGKRIAIDPYNVSNKVGKADLILITHCHYDHCSIKDIEKLAEPGTVVICTADSQSKITKVEGVEMHIIELGDKFELDDIKIETVPSYNKGKDFHPKSEGWLGYVIKIGKDIVYHAGDTDFIPEMQKVSGYGKHGNQFIALLPVSGTYVMDADEAAEAASLISPTLAIPMHYGSIIGTVEDAKRFAELCKGKNISARVLEKI